MAKKQSKNTKRTSAPTVQRISKEEFNKLRKRSIRNKVIAGVCTFIVGAGVGAGAYYGISDCWPNKDVPTPPPIEQGQGQTEEPTVSNVKNFASVNDFITADSQQLTQSYLNDVKTNDPQQRAYINIDLKLTIPLKLKFFEQTTEGECLGEINIEKVDYKGLYCKPDKFHIGILNITYDDLITVFPTLANYQLSTFDYLNEGKLGQVVGEDYFFANNGHRFYLNQEDPGKPAIRIATSNEGASEMPSDKVVELQRLEIGVVLQKIA